MSKPGRSAFLLLLSLAWGHIAAAPRWIEHASIPGPDVPDAGQSRFDQLFLRQDRRYQIPYPFSRLVRFLESRVENSDRAGVRMTLIPMGRSLQREAPAPDYFQFPRAVVAVEGEPITATDSAGEVLEYRLFVAHQPITNTLEIISYNDTAGRFEFQVVDNYDADGNPRVRLANRAMCLSCHQNAAPIFAMRPWSETNFNVAIASQLAAAQPRKFDSVIDIVTADPGVIDVLVERANYLAAAQIIWRRGCQSRSCRRALLRAILQYRLSGEANFDSDHPQYRQDYYAELSRNWKTQWPEGLALANSRIADRDPFASDPVPFEQDPLFPQPAHATWYRVDPVLARGVVYRLAGFLTLADIQRIDRRLIELSSKRSLISRKYKASCGFETGKEGSSFLSCGDADSAQGLQVNFTLGFRNDDLASFRVTALRIPRDSNLLQPSTTGLSSAPGRIEARLENAQSGLSQRLVNGDRVESLVLRWDDSLRKGNVVVEVTVTPDFQFIDQALSSSLDDSLADAVFRRKPVMQELAQALAMKPVQWRKPFTATTATDTIPSSALTGELALLEAYCSHCHGEAAMNPPGFLSGNRVEAKLMQCAPRMLARLKAWQADADFQVAPMPPPASLAIFGTTIDDWPRSDHYRSLVASLEKLAASNAQSQTPRDSPAKYRHLPVCLDQTNE